VGKGLNAHLGFLAGWVMFLDYLIVPVINTIYGALSLQRMIPQVPYTVWLAVIVIVITLVNLRGIRTTARSSELLLLLMCIVIGIFIVLSVKYIAGNDGWKQLLSYKPFYNPDTFSLGAVLTATSFAALTYIGFDGVTTLAEDVKNPKKNMLLAPVLVCLFTGLFSVLQIYLAQKVWPDYSSFANPETAFFDVAERVGGSFLFNAMAVILFVACLGSGIAGQVGAARLLFAMGRDGVIPGKIFAHLNRSGKTPVYNILLLGVSTFALSLFLSYQRAAELLNFGAFLAFMGVNIATLRYFYFRNSEKKKIRNVMLDLILPFLGFVVCFIIWISLPAPSKILGGAWMILGLVYLCFQTKGFRKKPVMFDFRQ
jgi:amino acid transporter